MANYASKINNVSEVGEGEDVGEVGEVGRETMLKTQTSGAN